MQSTDNKIIVKIKKAKRGSLFFTEDFLTFGTSKAIAKSLERLVKKQEITRVARGIYARLQTHSELGLLYPSTESMAHAIAKRDKARIISTGSMALNALGLSTQVPLNVVYLTDGTSRKITIDKRKIVFKKTSPKSLAAIGKISGLVIQAAKEIGKDKLYEHQIETIIKQLKKEEPYRLEHDIKLAPEWIRIIMRKAQIAINN
jgi:hypothetical protein